MSGSERGKYGEGRGKFRGELVRMRTFSEGSDLAKIPGPYWDDYYLNENDTGSSCTKNWHKDLP